MHPILFQTEFFTINTLWIFLIIGIISSTIALVKFSIYNGLKLQFISEHSWKMILWSLIGARIVALATNTNTYFYELSKEAFFNLFYIWDKGLNIWGAIIAFLIYFALLCKKHEQDFYKWMDAIIPAIILGLAISHMGAFFEGSNYGHETSLPWGVNFESPSIKYAVPIHPTQIYAAIYSVALFTSLILLNKSKKIAELKNKGFIAFAGVGGYQFFRFLEEFLRGDDVWIVFGIRFPQIVALAITISSGIILFLRYNKREQTTKSQ